ncbi:MAG: DUF5655 domain-containing protein [Myxococcota bacterium]
MAGTLRPLWHCPRCQRPFANRNQPHTCGPLRTVAEHLERALPEVQETYRCFEEAVRENGHFLVNAQKTRIAFQTRMHFGGARVHRTYVEAAFILPRRIESPRFARVDSFSRHNHAYYVRLTTPDDVDTELKAWLAEAYRCGLQEHVERPPRRPLSAPRTSAEKGKKPRGHLMVLERTMPGSPHDAEAAWKDARKRAGWLKDAALRSAVAEAMKAATVADKELGRTYRMHLEGDDAGSLEIAFAARGEDRCVVRVWHGRLPSVAKREALKRRWTEALETLKARMTS